MMKEVVQPPLFTSGNKEGGAMVATNTKRALLSLALALMSGGSGAQTPDPRDDEAEARKRIKESALPADTCLQRPSEMFYYPSAALKRDQSGLVRLALTFRRPDAPPEVEVLTLVGGPPLPPGSQGTRGAAPHALPDPRLGAGQDRRGHPVHRDARA
jgi:hypothetical protein